jgi:LPS-assembly lipoprotein
MHRRIIHCSLILGFTCMLAACGFQLRGTGGGGTELPTTWKNMHLVTGNPNGEFSRDVTAVFAANGVQWTDREDADFILLLGPDQFEQRNLSLNSEARVAELELTMWAEFSVVDASNTEVMSPSRVSVVKQMENNPRNVVGKDGEVRLIQNEMRTELAQQIMRRIGFYATNLPGQTNNP